MHIPTLLPHQIELLLDLSMICTLDEGANFIEINKTAEFNWGYKASALKGKNFLDFIHDDDQLKTRLAIAEVLLGKEDALENNLICKDSSQISIKWSAVWSAKDKIMFFLGRDITGLAKKEELIRLRESRLKSMLENGSDLITILDEHANYTFISPSLIRLLQCGPSHYLNKNAFSFIHPDDIDSINQSLLKLNPDNKIQIGPYRFLYPDGTWHWIESVLTDLTNDPAIGGILANSKDVSHIKQIEDEQQSIKKRLDNLIENNSDGFFTLNKNWIITYFNPVAQQMAKLPAEELKNKNFWEVFPKAIKSKYYTEYQRAFAENITVNFEEYYAPMDLWHDVTAYPYEDFLTVFVKDITEKKTQETSLKNSAENYKMLFSANPIAMWAYNPGTFQIMMANDAAVNLYGYSLEEFKTLDIFMIPPKEDHERLRKAISSPEIRIAGLNSPGEWRHLKKDGSIIHVEIISHSIILNDRKARLIAIKDITEKKESEHEFRMVNDRYKMLSKAANDAIWDWDVVTNKTSWNNAIYTIFGYSEADANHQEFNWWESNIHPDDTKRVKENFESKISNKETTWNYEYRFKCKNGEYKYVYDRSYFLYDETNQNLIRVIGSMQDISKLKENEVRILEQNQKLREIAQINSHEIRKPVASILGLMSLINPENFIRPDDQEIFELLKETTTDLDNVIRRIIHTAS